MGKKNIIEIIEVNLTNVDYEFALLFTQLITKYVINIIKEQSLRFGPRFIRLPTQANSLIDQYLYNITKYFNCFNLTQKYSNLEL